MSEVEFKVGDKVYCPDIDNGIHTLESYDKHLAIYYNRRDNCDVFYFDGTSRKSYAPRIFHATQENYELLSKLYPNIEFEPPPKRKEPGEVIQAMLNAGHKYVLCEVCRSKDGQDSHKIDAIVGFYRFFIGASDYLWDEATPITSKGQKIIDFIDGKVILED